jgi:large conductance mechanosensitive channel
MGFIKEFKEFAVRGNLVDTAVAFVMGAAFGKIVSSFVEGIVMPMVGMLTGGVDFNDKKLILQDAVAEIKNADGTIIPQ